MSGADGLPRCVLVANRGEIASRIMRTCRRLGVGTVAVYSDADRSAPHVANADRAVRIGPAPAADSYLNIPALIEAARSSGADSVHPGYGFLSERADFARAVADAGLTWIGPPASAIEALGDKVAARRLAIASGVPVAEGVEEDAGDAALASAIEAMGLPVMIKAAAGGGGRGMRLLRSEDDAPDGIEAAVAGARREAQAAFGDGRLLVERAMSEGRHVEVQVLFDQHGSGLHVGERDCSVQRRRQKVIEESPSPAVSDALREELGRAALDVCRAAGYVGAGTVEFMLMPDGAFMFLEVNTRLQVEHPVTEMLTGLDLVELQLRVASGDPLPVTADEVTFNGHAIETRIYAEDPSRGYVPSTGRLRWFEALDGRARHDVGPATGDLVTAHYDPMLAKTIVHAETRGEALDRATEALDAWAIEGVTTNLGQLASILESEDFRAGSVDIGWLDRVELQQREPPVAALAAAAVAEAQAGAWRSSGELARKYLLHGRTHEVRVSRTTDGWSAVVDGAEHGPVDLGRDWTADVSPRGVVVRHNDQRWVFLRERRRRTGAGRSRTAGANVVRAPMPGTMIEVLVAVGDEVEAGQTLAVMEAMKIEHLLSAPNAGVVKMVHTSAGASVDEDAVLIELGATS
ncbi:MAG: ATP-grasp domain-containing protein [Chloroflexi bacterium]|nr:ATP-grasp domain-containing protein [Chloroflexota bacterium]MCY3589073.1 ATP-grasp domain-containing protein [Chloroflexota bacterium]MCY3686270.1 ATP-grasp domain-containing protein [Chloroflexota bacterium]MDE2708891.1 ATP-grasp domain-containing protein [Chloroflexota bacterium]